MKRSSILGAWFLAIVTFIATARAADTQPTSLETSGTADFIIYNAKVLTVNSNFTVASAIAVRDGRILAVGKDRQLEEYRGPETRIIDAQGRTVMPGLYDAQVLSVPAAVSELKGPAPVINSIEDAQKYIRAQATNTPAGSWIVLRNIVPTRLKEGRLPTKDELDAATTNRPVYWDFDSMAVVNSKALEVSKIGKDTEDPKGGEIVRDPKHQKPTGLLRNAASLLKLPPEARPPTTAQVRVALKHLYEKYNEQGITSIGEAAVLPVEIDLLRDLSRSNELTVRVNCARPFQPSADADESIDRLSALTNAPAGKLPYGPTGVGDDWVRIGALRTIIDGQVNDGTAYLRTPYGIGPTYMISELAYRGVEKQDAFALPQVFLAAAQQGWQLSTHAAGDAALDFALNCYEQVQFKLDIRDRRFQLSHSDFAAAQDWGRSKKLGLGVILEPGDLYADGDVLTNTLGMERLKYYVPFKGWFNRGIVAGGASGHVAGLDSLTAANPWNPWLGMWTTLTRETKQGGEINPQEKLTREEAVRFYTINNAWLNFEDKVKGSLEPGKLADLIMLDTDIMKCPVDDIRNTKVLLTVVNGKVVWQSVEPIFPGPQVIPTFTGNAPLKPAPVLAPIPSTPVVVTTNATPATSASANASASTSASSGQSPEDATRHAAELTTAVNPFAPVIDDSAAQADATPVSTAPAPIATPASASVAAVSNAPASTSVAAQPVSTAPASASVSTTTNAPVAATSDTAASPGTFSALAGAAPAEVAANQAPAVSTNAAPAAGTNQVSNVIATNAANSVVPSNQPAVADASAATNAAPPPVSATSPNVLNQAAAVPAPNETAAAAASTPAQVASATAPAATTTTPASATTSTAATPAPDAAGTTSTAGITVPASTTSPAATASSATTPDATSPSTPDSSTVTNQATGGSQDWSRMASPGTK